MLFSKPRSFDSIREVVPITAANPALPTIYHSDETPTNLFSPYTVRFANESSIPLIDTGSGFGGPEDVWPCIDGDWSQAYGVQPMALDGAPYSSCVMVTKEAPTSLSVNKLICTTRGVDDRKREGTYTGGIPTVGWELGELTHKVTTRGIKLWKAFGNTVFNMPKEKHTACLMQNRNLVIKKLH